MIDLLQVFDPAVIPVITFIFPRERGVDGMMKVVHPLGIDPVAAFSRPLDQPHIVGVRFGDDHNAASQPLLQFPRRRGNLLQDMGPAAIMNGVDGIKAQPVEVVAFNPVADAVEDHPPRRGAAFIIEIHRRPPGCFIFTGKIGAKFSQVISFGAEVVIDDVENHGEPPAVAAIDKVFQIIGMAVIMIDAEEIDPVVAPVPAAGGLG